jgi:hypothetical protein
MWMRLLRVHDVAYVRKVLFRAAAREVDHHNNDSNWQVKREHELIFALNLRRRFPVDTEEARAFRARTLNMLRVQRLRALLVCARHARFGAVLKGLRFAGSTPLLSSNEPDSVSSWHALAQEWGMVVDASPSVAASA